MENEGDSIEAVHCDIAAGSWSRFGGGARRDVPALQAPSGSAVSGGEPIQPRTGVAWPDFVFRSTALRSAKCLLCDVPQSRLGLRWWAGAVHCSAYRTRPGGRPGAMLELRHGRFLDQTY